MEELKIEPLKLQSELRTQLQNYIDMLLRINVPFTIEPVSEYSCNKMITHKDKNGTTIMIFIFNSMGDLDRIDTKILS